MDRPRVTIHNMVSLDGELTGFPVDLGLYYEVAARLSQQAVLTGSGTLLDGAAREGVDLSSDEPEEPLAGPGNDDGRPWLVVVDSRGRLTRLNWLRGQPYWRDVLILCSRSTPAGHLDRLRRQRVEHVVAGDRHVDLAAALRRLADRYGVRDVRVDAGGTLNGLLLRAGLVDELSVIVAPHLAGTGSSRPVRLVDGAAADGPQLALTAVDRLRDDHVWLRYVVSGPPPAR